MICMQWATADIFDGVRLQIICEGPKDTLPEAMSIVKQCMSFPFAQPLRVDLVVDAKSESTWYKAK